MGLDQKNSLEVRARADRNVPSYLPHNVGRNGTAGAIASIDKGDLGASGHDKVAGHLEDEDVGLRAVDVYLRVEVDVRAPRVHARREGLPGDAAGPDVKICAAADGAPSRVRVGSLEVADGSRQLRRRGHGEVGRIGHARDLRRRGELPRRCRVRDQAETRQRRACDRTAPDVAGDAGRGDGGDAGLRQDGEVGRGAEEHGVGGREERECR
mmetsp:Transcript_24593/g.61106  ORF Transcript_24593/g.61106 Transcript_24593/m.61106 type:complete len:211 (+) Transcript_24593:544-1176(+)